MSSRGLESKFWGAKDDESDSESSSSSSDGEGSSSSGESSSSGSSSSSSSSGSSSSAGRQQAKKPAAAAVSARWAAMEDSSDEEEEKRVVLSAKDKQWGQLQQIIKQMNNHQRIEDFAQMQAGFEDLLKVYVKARTLDKSPEPGFVLKALIDLETYTQERFADKEWLRKLAKGRATAFNTLRAKVRKGLEPHRETLDEYRANPSAFAGHDLEKDASEEASESEEESEESSSEEESESEGSSEAFSDEEGTSSESSGSSSSSSSSSSSEDEGPKKQGKGAAKEGTIEDIHQMGLARWGKKTATSGGAAAAAKKKAKEKGKAARSKASKTDGSHPPASGGGAAGKKEDQKLLTPGEKIDAEYLTKLLQEVTALRGRKGFDRSEQIRHLDELAEAAQAIGPTSHLEILGHLISAYFDASLGAFSFMASPQWLACYRHICTALGILRKEPECYFPFGVTDDDADVRYAAAAAASPEIQQDRRAQALAVAAKEAAAAAETSAVPTAALPTASQRGGEGQQGWTASKARRNTEYIMVTFIERLDDELVKALQLTDVHTPEYKTRLGQTIEILTLLWTAYVHFNAEGFRDGARNISLRILEHMYYKNDVMAGRVWELVRKRLDSKSNAALPNADSSEASVIIKTLVKENLKTAEDTKLKVRLVLYSAYHESLHGRFYAARDLLQTANIHELASSCNISSQILYNRNLVQLGLAAFRSGLIADAHQYLSEVCSRGYKELLAQGMSNLRGVEKTAEQERLEKRRLLPYHMHIAADSVEAVHNICAMLLEVPAMAAQTLDSSKKPIARNFRRLLEAYEKQAFVGPPENPRETIMAATKCLQKADWSKCVEYVMSMKFWSSIPDAEDVKATLTKHIKQEALRTYLLSYAALYDSLSIKQLATMFDMPVSMAHSIVSKMMIQGSLLGSWDETSEYVLMARIERTPLQTMAVQMLDKLSLVMEQNETMLLYRNPKYVIQMASMRDDRPGRRFDDRWGGGQGNQDRRKDGDDRGAGGSYPFNFMRGNQTGGGFGDRFDASRYSRPQPIGLSQQRGPRKW